MANNIVIDGTKTSNIVVSEDTCNVDIISRTCHIPIYADNTNLVVTETKEVLIVIDPDC